MKVASCPFLTPGNLTAADKLITRRLQALQIACCAAECTTYQVHLHFSIESDAAVFDTACTAKPMTSSSSALKCLLKCLIMPTAGN